MYQAVNAHIAALDPPRLSAAEISGENHAGKPWKEHSNLAYPEFDLCAPLQEERKFDVVICEQVLEHVVDPCAAAANLRRLCAEGGHVIVSTPFLVKVHELPRLRDVRLLALHAEGPAPAARGAGLEVDAVGAWGNRQCVVGNLSRWSAHRRWHSLANEPDLAVQVWAFARNHGRCEVAAMMVRFRR